MVVVDAPCIFADVLAGERHHRHSLSNLAELPAEHMAEELALASKVVVDALPVHSGASRDAFDRGAAGSKGRKLGDRGVENTALGSFGVPGHRPLPSFVGTHRRRLQHNCWNYRPVGLQSSPTLPLEELSHAGSR